MITFIRKKLSWETSPVLLSIIRQLDQKHDTPVFVSQFQRSCESWRWELPKDGRPRQLSCCLSFDVLDSASLSLVDTKTEPRRMTFDHRIVLNEPAKLCFNDMAVRESKEFVCITWKELFTTPQLPLLLLKDRKWALQVIQMIEMNAKVL